MGLLALESASVTSVGGRPPQGLRLHSTLVHEHLHPAVMSCQVEARLPPRVLHRGKLVLLACGRHVCTGIQLQTRLDGGSPTGRRTLLRRPVHDAGARRRVHLEGMGSVVVPSLLRRQRAQQLSPAWRPQARQVRGPSPRNLAGGRSGSAVASVSLESSSYSHLLFIHSHSGFCSAHGVPNSCQTGQSHYSTEQTDILIQFLSKHSDEDSLTDGCTVP